MKRALLLLPVLVLVLLVALLVNQRSGSSTTSIPNDESDRAVIPDEPDADEPTDDQNSEQDIDPEITEAEIVESESPEPAPDSVPLVAYPDPPADARSATVRRLADGDSFDITWSDDTSDDEVRLLGINAPEGDACFGQDARSVLESFTAGQILKIDTTERDEFGRVLGDVWVNGVYLNAVMVEVGAALALSDDGNYTSVIAEAQQIAQNNNFGLWDPNECGTDPDLALRITDIQFDAPGRDDENQNGEWIEIANEGASPVDLSGWSIRDESTRHRYSFPNGYTLEPGGSVRLFSGCGDDSNDELYWCDADPVWNNGGDTGFLVDPDGGFADTYAYDG